jgi:hypothetical protein
MKITPNYRTLRDLFYNRINWQPNTVILKFPTITPVDSYTDFIGDSDVTYEESKKVVLKCFFSRVLNDIQRAKYGVLDTTNLILHISPLELEEKTGSKEFTERLMAVKSIPLEFNGGQYIPTQIKLIEALENDGFPIAFEFQLSED